jgi:hypothetical protein
LDRSATITLCRACLFCVTLSFLSSRVLHVAVQPCDVPIRGTWCPFFNSVGVFFDYLFRGCKNSCHSIQLACSLKMERHVIFRGIRPQAYISWPSYQPLVIAAYLDRARVWCACMLLVNSLQTVPKISVQIRVVQPGQPYNASYLQHVVTVCLPR